MKVVVESYSSDEYGQILSCNRKSLDENSPLYKMLEEEYCSKLSSTPIHIIISK